MSFKKNIFFCFFILSFKISYSYQTDSISYWLNKANHIKNDSKQQKALLLKSYQNIITNKKNRPLDLSSIAYKFYTLKDTSNFFKTNNYALKLAENSTNYYAIGDVNWNYATYYVRGQMFDKAYYYFNEAFNAFIKTDSTKETIEVLWGMTKIKGMYKDYAGSEKLTIKAIEFCKLKNDYENLFKLYNYLGLLQNDINEYENAIKYYHKAISYFIKLSRKTQQEKYIEVYNNIANVYFKKKEYQKALDFYDKELQNKNLQKDQYARVISNRAFCKLNINDTIEVKRDLLFALNIRNELKNKTDILASKIRLSDYYKYIKDTLTSFKFAKEANILAKEIKNGGDYLTTLQQLANLDKKNSKKYLDRYIEFNDSLISAERRMQNKFTRIEFETDEYIEETERLSQQRIWIIVTSIGGILILSLLYFLRVQKVKNEKLSIEAEHQKANEEVYILTLQQQARVEEERIKERNRISEELHDGILGKLFGTRFGLGFLPLEGDDETLEKHQNLLDELQDIEKEIRDVSHKLSDNFNSSDVNFTSIIKQLLEDKGIIGKFTHDVHFAPDISWKDIDEITKANVYRIIQEALQNIIKHAKASHVSIHFNVENNNLIIRIQDNGVGFDIKKGKKGIGIKNIKSRIEKLKGSIKIESEINVGTTLHINTPYIQQDAN